MICQGYRNKKQKEDPNKYSYYDDYMVDFDNFGYSLDEINIIKSVRDTLNTAVSLKFASLDLSPIELY